MEVCPALASAFRPVFGFHTTRPNNNLKPIAAAKFATPPPQRVSAPTSSNGTDKRSQVRSKPINAPKRTSKNLSASNKARESAIADIQDSPDLASALLRSGKVLKAQDLNVVLRHFGKLNRWNDLSQLFEWMRQHDKTNIASYSSYIRFIGRDSNSMKALEIYNSIKDESTRNNVSVCNSTLYCLISRGKFDSSLKIFNQMKQTGLVPDIVTYSTLLAGCTKVKGGYSKAMELVREIKSKGLHMDMVVYGTLISVCASNNQCEAAEKYFNEMKSEGHSPNVFHYSSLLNAYAVGGNYKKADELVQEMRSAGLVLNKVILTTLMKVYVKGGLFEKSKELLDELQALGYAEDEMPYCLLMDGLAKTGNLTEAKSVFDEMRRKEVKNDGYSYSIMISALCRNRLIEEAKQLACEFETKYSKYDVVILNSMLSAYCRSGEMENVMKMMKKMDELAISPDFVTFHILIKYFCKEKLYLLAYRTMEDMHRKGHQPEENLGSQLINRLGKTGAHSEAFSVYNMLRYSKRTINKALHEKILNILLAGGLLKDAYVVVKDNAKLISEPAIKKFVTSFMRKGNINLVNDVIKTIHNLGYRIDQDIFNMAISRYIEEPEKKELLFHLLQWMPGQGFPVDSSSRTLLLKSSHLFGQHSISESLSKHYMVLKTNKSRETKTK
ncbi:pentatricopeptide repeat-containing protein at1g10910 chloroplastic [Phtheirospermum japonicum]|uniref:Pentatricopeptide repeat-containing protein at1g10910 chloroplastic n=1 Tax=Phtheirospermum japonicum TaxID=374723 RepID=A0A830CLP2_9LAMI|nr:pentatricopeptide repeat-containing protein at1g10910 chloroplastic [Phtheirospermum japonicum]